MNYLEAREGMKQKIREKGGQAVWLLVWGTGLSRGESRRLVKALEDEIRIEDLEASVEELEAIVEELEAEVERLEFRLGALEDLYMEGKVEEVGLSEVFQSMWKEALK